MTLPTARRRLIEGLVRRSDVAPVDRTTSMVVDYARGATLDAIGKKWGVTREAVRQIINGKSEVTVPELKEYRRIVAQEERSLLRAGLRAWSESNRGVGLEVAAREFGVAAEQVAELLGKRADLHRANPRRRTTAMRATEEELLDLLRQFHAETGQTTAAGYTAWTRTRGVPGHQTVAIRFGRWNAALAAAGIRQAEPVPRESKYTADDLWAAAIEAFSAPDGPVTHLEFVAWLQEREGMPSDALIRNRLDVSFENLRHTALRMAATRELIPGVTGGVFERRQWKAKTDEGDDAASAIDVVRRAIEDLGPTLSSGRYSAWAKEHRRPSATTLQRRAGLQWGDLVAAAGGVPNARKNTGCSDEQLTEWMRRFLTETGSSSSTLYTSWQAANGAPSYITVATRFGGWPQAVAAARS